MDFSLTESQAMIRKTAREFFAAECPPAVVRAMERDERGYQERLWRQMAEMGWLGIVIPSAYGGQEAGFTDLLVLLQEMGRAAAPGPFLPTAVLGGLAILNAGSAEQKEALLPKIARGDLILGVAISEPGVDYALEQLETEATRENGGYVIRGIKLFVPYAHVADLLICVARTGTVRREDRQGLTLFTVEAGSPGVSVSPLHTNLRDRQFEVRLDGARVTAGSVLGAPGQGWRSLEAAMERAVVGKCAEMAGAAQRLLEMAVAHAKTRVQFGKPIGSFQAIQHHCANLGMYAETAELMTYRAGWLIEAGYPSAKAVAEAKAWTNEACKRAAALAHQVHGGIGFTPEHDLYLYSQRVRAYAHALGDTRWAHERIAEEMGM